MRERKILPRQEKLSLTTNCACQDQTVPSQAGRDMYSSLSKVCKVQILSVRVVHAEIVSHMSKSGLSMRSTHMTLRQVFTFNYSSRVGFYANKIIRRAV